MSYSVSVYDLFVVQDFVLMKYQQDKMLLGTNFCKIYLLVTIRSVLTLVVSFHKCNSFQNLKIMII